VGKGIIYGRYYSVIIRMIQYRMKSVITEERRGCPYAYEKRPRMQEESSFRMESRAQPGACNPGHSAGRDQEDRSSKPA
jgi:hypothetical protein